MNNQQHKKWDEFEGHKKGDIMTIPEKHLNKFLKKKKITNGVLVAFNREKRLGLIEFRSITYLDDKVNPPVQRFPMKWAPLDDMTLFYRKEALKDGI